MPSRGRSRVARTRLFVEFLEDRSNPAGFIDPFAAPLTVVDAPTDRLNVVTGYGVEDAGTLAALAASPFAADVRHVGFGIYTVSLAAEADSAAAATYFSGAPGVTAAEPDFTIQADLTPNDTQFSSLWGMSRIGAPTAWNTSTGSGNFVVAVIDSGVDYNHPDLAANMWHNPLDPIDGADNDFNGLVDDHYGAEFVGANSGNPMDDNGHGTHVAGTIGAVGNNGTGVVGVNWNVKIMALKFLSASGSGSTSDAVEALNYAVAHGVKVSNNSWGGGGYSSALFTAIQNAQNQGHVFVAAAGNSNVNITSTPSYPASYNLANVVAVGSTTSSDARSSFSNYSTTVVDIAAPGSGIVSTTPGNTYSNFSGTSMASPHVAGAIALYWDANPGATASQVINQLVSTADVVPGLTSVFNGGRRLNVAAMLQPTSPPPPPPADTTGARVTAAAFNGTGGISSVRFTFNEAITPGSFNTADVVSFTGPLGPIAATGVTAVSGSNNTQFDVTFATQTAGGTYAMTIGPAILDAAGNAMDQNQIGGNGQVPDDRYTATHALSTSSTQTFTAPGLPLPIRDFTYTRAYINVPQAITISDVNARFSATHTWDGDLVVRLIGPGGQTSTLVNRRGGSANNFTNTTLDDEAGVSITSGAAPFNGTYRPETTLTTFDGRNALGTWTLEVYDAAAQDIGSLSAFSLIITGTNGFQSVTAFGFRDGAPFNEPVRGATFATAASSVPAFAAPERCAVPYVEALAAPEADLAWAIPVDAPVAPAVTRPTAFAAPALPPSDTDAPWWDDLVV